MADQIIKIDKSTVDNQIANKSIDRSFTELIPKEDLVSLDQFFDLPLSNYFKMIVILIPEIDKF